MKKQNELLKLRGKISVLVENIFLKIGQIDVRILIINII